MEGSVEAVPAMYALDLRVMAVYGGEGVAGQMADLKREGGGD